MRKNKKWTEISEKYDFGKEMRFSCNCKETIKKYNIVKTKQYRRNIKKNEKWTK